MISNIFKKTLALATVCATLISNTIGVFAMEKGIVNCDLLNVRVSPNTNCDVVDRMINGTIFDIVYTDNGWYNICMDNGITGFVSAEYVTKIGEIAAGNKTAAQIAENAHNYIGYPYSYGSSGPSAFDCSGFTSYLYKQYGYTLPRTSYDQGNYGTYIDKENLVSGDLVFFSNRSDRRINHVGIYIGNNEFIHASTSIRGVVKDSLTSEYYVNHYVTARRVL